MDNRHNYDDPWESGIYGTGRTRPRKRRWGCVAVLLVLAILMAGFISLLGFLNIRLVALIRGSQLQGEGVSMQIDPIATMPTDPTEEPSTAETVAKEAFWVNMNESPLSVPNVPQEGGMSLQEIYEKNSPTVVSILCDIGSGTGVILAEQGYIVTNCHVVEGASSITVLLHDGREYTAALVGADSVTDLAVLYIEADALAAAEFGDSAVLRVGDSVAAIGDPLGIAYRGTMTNGIVSAINRDVHSEGRTMTLIQTNVALNSGNSGGPLINCYGQVVGINTMKVGVFSNSSGVEGIGFAIPSTTVQEIVNQLINQGYVSGRPSLGIAGASLDKFDQYYFHLPAGLYIETVAEGSPAQQVGIAPGDVLMQVGDTKITDTASLEAALASAAVGDTVMVYIYRGGQTYQAELELIEAKG